ncbi:MAG TPA: hypothetical protein VEH49_09905, partial [Methylomirabilota bacterium]|nr:hypothetical protein [Methylomirabilota bacterium]
SVTGISHTSPSGSSAQVGSGVTGGEGVQQIFWDVQTWTNATTHTLTMSGSGNNNDVTYYCIAGAASTGQPDSSLATASGTDSSAPGTLNTYAITPSSSSGIMIATTGVALGHTTSCGPAGYQDNMDNNNNWCHFAYSSTASQQFSITKTGSGAGAWSGAGAAFKSASAASAAPAFDKRKKLDRLETQ